MMFPNPIPNEQFASQHKNNLLDKFLVSFLKEKFGLAKHSYQWIGFIPHDIADKAVKNNDYIKESIYGVGLFHGALSHMLQLVIYLIAIEKDDIDLSYEEQGSLSYLSLKDYPLLLLL